MKDTLQVFIFALIIVTSSVFGSEQDSSNVIPESLQIYLEDCFQLYGVAGDVIEYRCTYKKQGKNLIVSIPASKDKFLLCDFFDEIEKRKRASNAEVLEIWNDINTMLNLVEAEEGFSQSVAQKYDFCLKSDSRGPRPECAEAARKICYVYFATSFYDIFKNTAQINHVNLPQRELPMWLKKFKSNDRMLRQKTNN